MNMFRKALLASAVVLVASTGLASATPLTGSFSISVWYGSNPSPFLQTDPQEQALPTNPIASGAALYSGTYTGAINFSSPGSGQGNILSFLTSAGGTLSGTTTALNHIMSSSNFSDATLIKISFSTANTISGNITHDDGISIAQGSSIVVDSSAPTSATPTSYSLAAGNYDLWYAEVNGLPAVLNFDVTKVPEPVSLSLLGAGLVGLGVARRRKNRVA